MKHQSAASRTVSFEDYFLGEEVVVHGVTVAVDALYGT